MSTLNREHPAYRTWVMMRQRCNNQNAVGYKNYGGRGVKICKKWSDFKRFALDVGAPPSDAHTLDRYPNQNGDYEPSNVRGATYKEQQRNRTNNRRLELDGVKMTISEWSEETGLRHDTICRRLERGWSVKAALTKKLKWGAHKNV